MSDKAHFAANLSTSSQPLYERIKQDILDNKLPINSPLKQEALSQRYGVSRIPIRDTLLRLKLDGWLHAHGKRGVMVAPLNAQEAEDLYKMRMLIEPLILVHVVDNVSMQTIGQAHDILLKIENEKDLTSQALGELNWHFHACLYACAQRSTLFDAIENLHQKCSRYIGYHNSALNYLQTSEQEHHLLLRAIQDNKLAQAQSILKEHIQNAGELLVSHLKTR